MMPVAAEGLTYTYPNAATPAIVGLEFGVGPGEVFGFLGPSGAGKSTTQKILVGLLHGHAGRAAVLGREVDAWGDALYERIGVSFELPNHFLKLTGRENLEFFARMYRGATRPVDELLDSFGLLADAGQRVAEYSKGMKVRLGVARALLHSPELLFLDEPTAGLDPVNSRRVRDLVRAEADAGRAVFLTTHDMSTADEVCDRVGFIVDGQIAAIGAPRQLKLDHGRRRVRVEYREDARRAVREFDLDGLAGDAEFQRLLADTELQTLHSLEATLAEVFIAVTGRELD